MNGPWIQTYTGKQFEYYSIQAAVCIEDIARSLSNICRFNGHCAFHYSVAQHSVLVSQNTANQFYGLMHDAEEAYVGDMVRPLKQTMGTDSRYTMAGNQAWQSVCNAFPDLLMATPEDIADCKNTDMRMLVTESHDVLLGGPHEEWEISEREYPRYPFKITPWTPDDAMHRFIERYNLLTGSKVGTQERCQQCGKAYRYTKEGVFYCPCWGPTVDDTQVKPSSVG
jgi:5'-deoxynucleotidase YfbR-like HD superfamily hydrolase